MTKTTTETTMTEVDMMFQVASRRIQGLTEKVNYWKQRANELDAALGTEKAARISAEATRDRALNAGAENVSLQEELQKERSDHEETCRYLADAQARIREMDDTNRSLEGALDRLRFTFGESDVKKQAEILNLRGDLTTARDERDRALEKFCDEKAVKTFDCTIDAIRAEVADLRGTFDAVHFALGIKSGDNIIEAIYRLKSSDWFDERNRLKYQVIPDLEKERNGLTTQVQDMRNEIARLRADLRDMSDRSDGSEWEKKAAEIEELRAELNSVKQELDCAKSEWDRAEGRCKALGGEVAEMFSDRQRLKAELAVIKDERNELRAKLEAIEAESRGCYEELSKIRRNALSCEPSAPTLRSHPVKVGEWVKRPIGFNATPGCEIAQVISANAYPDGYVEYVVLRPNGKEDAWTAKYCIPCDPPESTEAADNALEEQSTADIKVGDYVEVFQATNECWTREDEIGIEGTVQHIEMTAHSIPIVLLSNDGAYALRDVRKIQREPKPGDYVRLVRVPTPGPDFDGFIDFPWNTDWGAVGDVAPVVATLAPPNLPVIAVRVPSGLVVWWPLSCVEVVRTEPDDFGKPDMSGPVNALKSLMPSKKKDH